MASNNKSFTTTATTSSGLRPSVSIHERIGVNGPGLMRNLTIEIPNATITELPGHYDQQKSLISFQTSKLKDQLEQQQQQQMRASDLNNNTTTTTAHTKVEWQMNGGKKENNNDSGIIVNEPFGKMLLATPKQQHSKFPVSASSTFISQLKSEINETTTTSRSAVCNNNNNNNTNYSNWESIRRQPKNYNASPVKFTNENTNPYHYYSRNYSNQQQQQRSSMPMRQAPSNSIYAKYAPRTSFDATSPFSMTRQSPVAKRAVVAADNNDDDDDFESSCSICDRKDQTVFCKNCSADWKVSISNVENKIIKILLCNPN